MTQSTPFFRRHTAPPLALEPRMMFDAAAVTTAAEVATQVDVSANADTPGVSATPSDNTISITNTTDSFPTVALFSDVHVTLQNQDDGRSNLTSLVITVDNSGSDQALVIDGATIELVDGNGNTSDNDYAYTVSVSGNTTTITVDFNSGTTSTSEVENLITGLSYQLLNKPAASGSVTISLQSLDDAGGQSADLSTIKSIVTIDDTSDTEQANSLSLVANTTIGAETGSLGYADLIVSNDWPNPYDGAQDAVSVGDQVYLVRTASIMDWDIFEEVETTTLYIFQRNTDGSLSLSHTIDASEENGLKGAFEIGVSADGQSFYSVSAEGVALFTRDSNDGTLTALGKVDANLSDVTQILVEGDHLYATQGNTLQVFQRNGNTWSLLDTESLSENSFFTALQLSADKQFLFVGNSGADVLVSVFRIEADGSLTHIADTGASGSEYYTNNLTLSHDGKILYAAGNGTLQALTIGTDGSLTLLGPSIALADNATKQLIVSQDGAAVLVVSETAVSLYTRNTDGTLNTPIRFNSFAGLARMTLTNGTLSGDGSQLYLTGTFPWDGGLLVLDLKGQDVAYSEGGNAVSILPGGLLNDPQLNALNNGLGDYKDASVVIERQAGANSNDAFGFKNDNGFTLDNGQIKRGTEVIGDFEDIDGKLTLTFVASISQADAQTVLRNITYSNRSNDPGNRANLSLTLNDSAPHIVEVAITEVNNAPIVSVDGKTLTFNAEGERVPLFENPAINTVEAGQHVAQVILTLDAIRGSGDVIGVGTGRIIVDQAITGVQTTASGQQYQVLFAGGQTQVILFIGRNGQETAAQNIERAKALINTLTYGNTGSNLSGARTISLGIRDSGGGSTDTATASSTSMVSLQGALTPNSAPEISGNATADYIEKGQPILIAPSASVSDAQMGAFNGGSGNYDGAVLTITLGDGKSTADSLAFSAGSGLTLVGGNVQKDGRTIATLTNSNGVMTIRFSDAAGTIPTTADVENTLRQITYANSSNAPVANVEVSITLTDQRGLESPALAVTIAIEAINDAPSVGNDPVLSLGELERLQALTTIAGLDAPVTSTVSADGRLLYVADAKGAIALFSRSASGELTYVETIRSDSGVTRLAASPDGKSLYAVRVGSSSTNGIVQFAMDDDGKLTRVATSATDLFDIRDIAISEDGNTLYTINGNNSNINMFSRASDGTLTSIGTQTGNPDMGAAPYLWAPAEIESRGNLLYVVTKTSQGSTLIIYERSGNTLSLLTHQRITTSGDDHGQQLAVSADGRTIVIANGMTTSTIGGWDTPPETVINNNPMRVDILTLDLTSNTLTRTITISETAEVPVRDIAVSADGNALFVTLNDGSLAYYSTITGEKLPSSQSGISNAGALTVTRDGGVIVLGDGVSVFTAPSVTTPALVIDGAPVDITKTLTFSDPELDAIDNYQGASVSFTSSASGIFGLTDTDTIKLVNGNIQLGGTTVATFANGVLRFTDNVSKADANAILRQVNYRESGNAQPGSRTISVTFDDGDANGTQQSTHAIELQVINANRAPTIDATPTSPAYTGDDTAVNLFTGVSVSIGTGDTGQTITELTLTVAGVGTRGQEWLIIDDQQILLAAGTTGTLSNGLQYSVTSSNGGLQMTLSSTAGITDTAMQTLIAGIQYGSNDLATSGSRSITLTGISDNGGIEQGGVNTQTLSLTSTVDVTAFNHAPEVTGPVFNLPQAITGRTYVAVLPETLFTDSDGDTLTWDVSGLPAGMTFDAATRTISGIAQATGSFTVTIEVTDAGGKQGSHSVTLVIGDNRAPESGTTTTNPDAATVGTSYVYTLPSSLFTDADGDTLVWEVTGLPDGMTFDAASRTIRGTASSVGDFTLTITVTDPDGLSSSRTLTLSVGLESMHIPIPQGTFPSTQPGTRDMAVIMDELRLPDQSRNDGEAGGPGGMPIGLNRSLPSSTGLGLEFVRTGAETPIGEPASASYTLALLDALRERHDEENEQRAPTGDDAPQRPSTDNNAQRPVQKALPSESSVERFLPTVPDNLLPTNPDYASENTNAPAIDSKPGVSEQLRQLSAQDLQAAANRFLAELEQSANATDTLSVTEPQ